MKISIQADPQTLYLIHAIVLKNTQLISTNKSGKSMCAELFEILAKRCIAYAANPNGKPRSFTLRYHLAEKLLELVKQKMMLGDLGVYENNKLELFKNDLHKKLL
jgi:hypothetical protein